MEITWDEIVEHRAWSIFAYYFDGDYEVAKNKTKKWIVNEYKNHPSYFVIEENAEIIAQKAMKRKMSQI